MLSLRIAYKYLSSKKSHSVVNLIARTAVISIAIPVAAAILVLSLQKGLAIYIGALYDDFDAPLKIERTASQPFTVDSARLDEIRSTQGVADVSCVLQGEVLLEYASPDRYVATIKGVDTTFANVVNIRERITHGEYRTRLGDINQLIMGQGVAYYMGINPALKKAVTLYSLAPQVAGGGLYGTIPNYNKLEALPVGIFAIDETVDSRYVLCDLQFAQQLLRKPEMVTSLDVSLTTDANLDKVKEQLQTLFRTDYKIVSRQEQHASLFRIMNIERWIIFALLVMITALASLSLCGTIVMMKTEKKIQNRALLQMGFPRNRLQKVYTNLGMMITFTGLIIGLALGFLLVFLQDRFALLKMGGDSMLLDAYPVSFDFASTLYLILVTLTLGYIISHLTSRVFKHS